MLKNGKRILSQIDQLDRYEKIGCDFDGTLIDHPNSSLMHRYILDHPEKVHFIVTFRTHGMQRTVFPEMSMMYPDAPTKNHFADLFNIEDKAWERFMVLDRERLAGLRHGELLPWELYYITWKGSICKQNGIGVLIDDRPELVVPGCEKHGIAFVHPDTL